MLSVRLVLAQNVSLLDACVYCAGAIPGSDGQSIEKCGFRRSNTLILETREANETFPAFNPNHIPLRIKMVTAENIAVRLH